MLLRNITRRRVTTAICSHIERIRCVIELFNNCIQSLRSTLHFLHLRPRCSQLFDILYQTCSARTQLFSLANRCFKSLLSRLQRCRFFLVSRGLLGFPDSYLDLFDTGSQRLQAHGPVKMVWSAAMTSMAD